MAPIVTIAGSKVVSAGTLVSYGYQSISIYPFSDFNSYQVEIEFENNNLLPAGSKTTIIGPLHVKIAFNLFDNPSGAATAVPVHIANRNENKFFLSIASYFLGEGAAATRVVHYTFTEIIA